MRSKRKRKKNPTPSTRGKKKTRATRPRCDAVFVVIG